MDPESYPEPGTIEYFYDTTWGETLLWIGTLGGPGLVLLHLQVNYSLVEWTCITGNQWILYLSTAVFFILVLATGLLSFWNWKRIGAYWPVTQDEGIRARTRLLAVVGIMLSATSAAVMIAQGLSYFFFSPCEM